MRRWWMETTQKRKRETRRTKQKPRGMRMKNWRKSVSVKNCLNNRILILFIRFNLWATRGWCRGHECYRPGDWTIQAVLPRFKVCITYHVGITSPFFAGPPKTVPRCLSMCATSPSRRKPDLFSPSLTKLWNMCFEIANIYRHGFANGLCLPAARAPEKVLKMCQRECCSDFECQNSAQSFLILLPFWILVRANYLGVVLQTDYGTAGL